jgi:hypothetical protein
MSETVPNVVEQPKKKLSRAERRKMKKLPELTPVLEDHAADTAGEVLPYERPGTQLRTKANWAKRGFYAPALPGAPSSTKQAAVLNTSLVGPPTGTHGICSGRDILSHSPIAHDPVTAYNSTPQTVSSPNVIVLGVVGGGKSSLVKTVFVIRPLLLKNRRVVVFDKKSRETGEGSEGEYSELVREFGGTHIKFTTDGTGTTFNVLDKRITRGTGARGHSRLIQNIVRLADDSRPLSAADAEAIRAALRMTRAQYADRRRDPVLTDLLPNLSQAANDPAYQRIGAVSRDELARAGARVEWVLNGLLEEYAGLLDGETSAKVDLSSKLTSFDISQLPDDGPAIPVVMAIGNMWMLGRIKEEPGKFVTNVVYEEGWHMIGGPSAQLLKSNQKLSRSLGISNVFVMHKGTDIPKDSPGYSIIQEAQSMYIYRQDRPEDAEWCVRAFDFHPDTAGLIQNLGVGEHIFKMGSNTEAHVQHIRSDYEVRLTNTDEGMAAAAALGE